MKRPNWQDVYYKKHRLIYDKKTIIQVNVNKIMTESFWRRNLQKHRGGRG